MWNYFVLGPVWFAMLFYKLAQIFKLSVLSAIERLKFYLLLESSQLHHQKLRFEFYRKYRIQEPLIINTEIIMCMITNHTPISFVDSLDARKHIALFYDEPEYARLIEFRFLKNGLEKGEQCVYTTEEDSGYIVLKMLSYGIPLEYFERKKMRVYQLHNRFANNHELMENCKKI